MRARSLASVVGWKTTYDKTVFFSKFYFNHSIWRISLIILLKQKRPSEFYENCDISSFVFIFF